MKNKAQKNLWRKKLYVSLLLSGLTAVAVVPMASAEEVSEVEAAPAVEASAEEGDTPEIVVSATRTEMAVKDAPATVIVINREQIEQRQANNVVDILRDVAGVYVKPSSEMSMDSPIRIRGSASNHVLILIDGRRINGEMSSMNARELERLRLDNVERVEIIKGSSSALYGSDALGGVVNVITRDPKKTSLELYANYRNLEGDGSLSNNMGAYFQSEKRGSFAWALGIGRNYRHDLDVRPNQTSFMYGREIPLTFKGVWDIKKDHQLRLDLGYLKEDLKTRDLPTSAMSPYTRTEYDNERFDYSLEYLGKNKKSDWQVRFYGSEYEKNYAQYHAGTGALRTTDYAKNKSNILEGRISSAVHKKHMLTGGFEVGERSAEGTRILQGGGKDEIKVAAYIQDEWMPSERWLIIPAARFEKVEEFSASVTPRLGATYFYRPDLRFKANIATGYRTPSLAERYNDWIMGGMIHQIGNPDLKAEKSVSGEFSVEKDWKNHDLKVGIYRSEVKDLIVSEMLGVMPSMRTHYYNADEAILQGLEINSSHKLGSKLQLKLGYNYLHGFDNKTDERLPGRARNQGTVGLVYQPTKAWTLNMDNSYLHDYLYSASSGEKHSFWLSNVNASYKFGKTKNGTIYLGVENLFDHKEYDLSHYGRTYLMGVNYKF